MYEWNHLGNTLAQFELMAAVEAGHGAVEGRPSRRFAGEAEDRLN
jgi:hypothetical protein